MLLISFSWIHFCALWLYFNSSTAEQQTKDLKTEANVTLCYKSDFLLLLFPCTLDGWEAQIISLLTPPVVVCTTVILSILVVSATISKPCIIAGLAASRKLCMTSLLYLPHIYTHSVLFSLNANFPFSHLPPASLQISVLSSNITVYGRWVHLCPSPQQPAVGLHAEKEWESPLFLTQLQQQLYPIWALHITLVPGNKYVQILGHPLAL